MTPYVLYRHPDVENDLFSIVDLLTEYAGAEIARSKLRAIERSIVQLSETPHIGTIRHEIYPDLRVIPTAKKGVISFVVDDDSRSVFVVSITYAGADWISQLYARTGQE